MAEKTILPNPHQEMQAAHTRLEADGRTVVNGDGDVLPSYEGINTPDFGEKSPDELMADYGHLAVEGVKPEMPQELKDMAEAGRQRRRTATMLDKVIELRKNRPLPPQNPDTN